MIRARTSSPAGRPARVLPAAGLALVLVLGAGGCSGDDEPDPAPAGQSTDQGETFEIETRTTLGRVAGRLSRADRQRLPDAVTEVVQRWFDAAYVGGEFPRSDFKDAFPGFTRRAAAEARQDRDLMTNAAIGDQVDQVTPTKSRIRLDVLAPGGRASGATARFVLAFRTEGEVERRVQVRGRLLLTRENGAWRIFGYDVTRGDR